MTKQRIIFKTRQVNFQLKEARRRAMNTGLNTSLRIIREETRPYWDVKQGYGYPSHIPFNIIEDIKRKIKKKLK